MTEPNGRDLLREWRRLMEGVVSSAVSATGRRDLAADLLGAMQHQLELVQEVIDGERRWQGELAGRLLAPLDAGFDLLEQTAASLRQQAEALQSAGRALEESAGMMKSQAELFERAIGVLREPAELARQAAGLERRAKAGKRASRKRADG